jgi:hypothetical protein
MANTKLQIAKKFHIVYKTVNLKNKHIYIGAHSTDYLEDGYIGSGYKLQEALSKYGKENFKREILHVYDCPLKMFEKEKEIVNEEFIRRRDVYNIVTGGYGGMNKGASGLKHMHCPITKRRIAVHPSAIDKMLNEGFIIGRGTSSTTGRIWIYNGSKKKMVDYSELENHLSAGWSKGLPASPTKNKIWIYHPFTETYSLCETEDVLEKLSEGWIKKKWAPIKAGKSIWVTDGIKNTRIPVSDLEVYIHNGWRRGMVQNHSTTP